MEITFTDKIRIMNTPKQYIVFELFENQRYKLYFTDDPRQYPRHQVNNGVLIRSESAREQLEETGYINELN